MTGNVLHSRGVALALGGGLCLSSAGILLRYIESADGWQILFYRSLTFFITMALVVAWRYRSGTLRAFVALGLRGWLAGLVLGLGSITYIYAILLTSVANAVFIIGSAPLLTALLAWLVLSERLGLPAIFSMVLAFLGIGLMFADGIESGGMAGNICALAVALSYAIYLLLVRNAGNVDMLPAISVAGLFTAGIAWFMTDSIQISNHDLVITVLLGTVQFSAGFMLLTLAARYIAAAEVALFSLSEAILAPLWVWLLISETPSLFTISGASIVLVAVVGYILHGIKVNRTV